MKRLITLVAVLFFVTCSHTRAQNNWVYLKGNASDFHDLYGTINQAHPTNTPGLRLGGATWTLNGKLYLFGGSAFSYNSSLGTKSDIWEYDTLSRNWRWIKGSKGTGESPVYGTKGVANSANTPGARSNGASWVYNNKLYFFGGGTDELWVFDPATTAWTWLGGNDGNQKAVYGAKGIAAATNQPGSRDNITCWQHNGLFYMYGGHGNDSLVSGVLNDIWTYDPVTAMWTWVGGPKTVNAPTVRGTMGVAAANNTPGPRSAFNTWYNGSKFYLMGGGWGWVGSRSSDLWEYDLSTNMWTWIKGGLTVQPPVYGTKGVASSTNTPGDRLNALTWTNNSKLYLYSGIESQYGNDDPRDDFWEFDPATNNWTWLSGSTLRGQKPDYGVKGQFAVGNHMGARQRNAMWHMPGRVFVMGGFVEKLSVWGYISNDLWEVDVNTQNCRWLKGMHDPAAKDFFGAGPGREHYLNTPSARPDIPTWQVGDTIYMYGGWSVHNDVLWRYNPNTNNWAWVKGFISDTAIYGTVGVAHPSNTPGKLRSAACTWTLNNKLYLFSGSAGWTDLWEFDLATHNWRLLKHNNKSHLPVYGTKGIAAAGNTPGQRVEGMSWANNGKLYLFGGAGFDQGGNMGHLNDLWVYDPATNNWTWLKGSSVRDQYGVYGTKGVAAANNNPGGREKAVGWALNNKFYVFGGIGFGSSSAGINARYLNDLWEYDIATNNWRWLKGTDLHDVATTFGTKGVPAATNTPGGRQQGMGWTLNNKLYLFGGSGFITVPSGGRTNDFWQYDPATDNWTWIGGSNTYDQNGYYDTEGIPNNANMPGARWAAATWTYANRLYFMGGESYPANVTYNASEIKNDIWYYEACNTPAQCYPNAPVVTLDTLEICNGKAATLNAGNTGAKFLWSTGDTTQNISVSVPGTYWVRVTNGANLIGSDTTMIVAGAGATVDLGSDTIICGVPPLVLDAQNTGAAYYWNTGATTQTISVSLPSKYTVNVVKANGCTATDDINVLTKPMPPVPVAAANGPLCTGDTLILSVANFSMSSSYNWYGPSGFYFSFAFPQTYNVTLADSGVYIITDSLNGCWTADTILVTIDTTLAPSVSIAATQLTTGPWNNIAFTATPVNGGSAATYQWQKNGVDIPGATASVYNGVTGIDLLTGDMICVKMKSSQVCTVPDTAVSKCLTVNVNLGVDEVAGEHLFRVYPNPNNGDFTIRQLSGTAGKKTVAVLNQLGQVVWSTTIEAQGSAWSHEVRLNDLPAAVYTLQVQADGKVHNSLFTVTR